MALTVIREGFLSLEAIEAERCRRSFAHFVRQAWGIADPGSSLLWSTPLDGICACLQAVTEGRLRDLVINVPPGHSKSLSVSVLWPAWVWTRDPNWQAIFSSYEMEKLVMRDAVRTKDLTNSDWYVSRFRVPEYPCGTKNPHAWEYSAQQDTKAFSRNSRGGSRIGTSVGTGTGLRGSALVVDDPLRAHDADSEVAREGSSRWFWQTMSTRFNDPRSAARVVIMQRLHEADLAGECIERGFQCLNLPSYFDPARRSTVYATDGSVIWADPRTEPGQLLFPELFDAPTLAKLKVDLGSIAFSAQHQQDPAPEEGGKIKRDWFAPRWHTPQQQAIASIDGHRVRPTLKPDRFSLLSIMVDCAFRKTETSDYVAAGVFGLSGPRLYLLDLVWARMTFVETLQALRALHAKWQPHEICVEARANGDAVINVLSAEIPGFVAIEPDGGKESRIFAAAPKIEAGNLYLPLYPDFSAAPDGTRCDIEDLILQAIKFPKAAHDDAIDVIGYAINRLLTGSPDMRLLESLAAQ